MSLDQSEPMRNTTYSHCVDGYGFKIKINISDINDMISKLTSDWSYVSCTGMGQIIEKIKPEKIQQQELINPYNDTVFCGWIFMK